MAKHTAAPWGVSTQSTNTVKQFDALGETNVIIAAVLGGKTSGPFFVEDDGEVAANTLLIAAAPELLEALQDMVKWFGSYPEFVPSEDHYKKYRSAIESANAAIAKASGQCLKGEE